ncbi:hypothetical protein [Streptomyces kronopolitis]
MSQGKDIEMVWPRPTAERDVAPAVLAGFVEGLASTRDPVQWGGDR